MSLPLYRRVLGPRFAVLPTPVRELHELELASQWVGMAHVERGRSRLSRLAAWIAGLPPDGRDQALCVTFEPVGAREIWTRRFGEVRFRSVQYERNGFLCERTGPTTFVFTPVASGNGLALRLDGFRLLGLPLPRLVHPACALGNASARAATSLRSRHACRLQASSSAIVVGSCGKDDAARTRTTSSRLASWSTSD